MTDQFLDILHRYWGYPDFRGIQRDIIESVAEGRDTLGLMPTGGGKSITFQVPALAQKGVCVVITPLISLMKDQVDHLRAKGIQAAAIYSGMRHDDIVTTLDNCCYGGAKLLYVSPERLSSELFLTKLSHMRVSLITVDEAHCISQWGYDFRPSYLHIAAIRDIVPNAPVLALTATATPKVIDDIQEKLNFRQKNCFRMSYARPNLAYVVRHAEDKDAQLVHILSNVKGSAVVYARSRQRTKDLAKMLVAKGVSATFYHAGLEPNEKDQRQDEWQQGKTRIMVATNAFGMGIDKADVQIVVHYDLPSSLEEYFQEAGRAGRDGNKAYAVALYNGNDNYKLKKRVAETFPTKDEIRLVYDHLAYYYEIGNGSGNGTTYEFSVSKFCSVFRHFPLEVEAALMILQRAGYLLYQPNPDGRARVRFLLGRDELYRLRECNATEDAVITSLLRHYGGLFADYVYIDDSYVAEMAGLDRSATYLALRALTQRRILDFIPRRNVPLITYTRDRVLGDELVITPEVYEDRKAQFESRINAVIRYCENNEVCRSRQLLRYFGETKSVDCDCCDVCIAHRAPVGTSRAFLKARQAILELLSDGKSHDIAEFHAFDDGTDAVTDALTALVEDERIRIDGWNITLDT